MSLIFVFPTGKVLDHKITHVIKNMRSLLLSGAVHI